MTKTVAIAIEAGVATLTLTREERLNALTPQVFADLREALDTCERAKEVKCVVLTGAGRAFCSGQDLSADLPRGTDGSLDIAGMLDRDYNPLVVRLRSFPKPTVAAVNGPAVGAGASLAMACDIVLASQSSYFQQAFVQIGLMPDAGGTWMLPRIIGARRALGLMLTGDRLAAGEAERAGLVYAVFPDETFQKDAISFARKIGAGSATAMAAVKTALAASTSNALGEQLALERDLQASLGTSADFAEGVSAFKEKRPPKFR